MIYKDSKITNCKIAYIGGGSPRWAWRLMADFALEPDLTGTVALYDIDFASAKRNEIIGNRLSSRPECIGKWDIISKRLYQNIMNVIDIVNKLNINLEIFVLV